jgi:hypothetical protein
MRPQRNGRGHPELILVGLVTLGWLAGFALMEWLNR